MDGPVVRDRRSGHYLVRLIAAMEDAQSHSGQAASVRSPKPTPQVDPVQGAWCSATSIIS
jgi:hypothetical protein